MDKKVIDKIENLIMIIYFIGIPVSLLYFWYELSCNGRDPLSDLITAVIVMPIAAMFWPLVFLLGIL